MAQTVILGRELTMNEAYRSMLGCVAGPLGWVVADMLVPPTVGATGQPPKPPRKPRNARQGQGRNINIPGAGVPLVGNEILLEVAPGTPQAYLDRMAAALQLAPQETHTFALTGRTLQRWRINSGASPAATLGQISARFGRVTFGQGNLLYGLSQAQASKSAVPATDTGTQYVVSKLHLLEAHRITGGDDVLVAVIDSKIDTSHPDLAGVIADEYDALGGTSSAHAHGTGMAGAIAAHSKLIGVAPKVKLLAVRAFAGVGDGAQGTTFNILKGLDWAASKDVRVVNMSFAGPADMLVREMVAKAHARGIVLIAAAGNAGPRSPPLYPAADPDVIAVTATDADDKLLAVANRGPHIAVAAPGVQVLVPAPDGAYVLTTGTSVAAAHASGVAALLLARKADLKPNEVRSLLMGSARKVAGQRREVGAGVIDAFGALSSLKK